MRRVTACVSASLQLGYNGVASFEALAPLQLLPCLSTLYVEHNPIASDFEYRMRLRRELTALTQLDATPCR